MSSSAAVEIEKIAVALDGGTTVSAEIARSGDTDTVVILGHGAGADMRHAFMTAVHIGLAARGLAVVKFNFSYTEQKRRLPDRMPALEACYRRVVEQVEAKLRPARLVLGGKSMGGRVASHLAAQGVACAGLVFFGYPLHPAGKPEQQRSAHLPKVAAPMLFLTGSRDNLCELDLLRPVLATLHAPATLHVIEGGDHSFKVPKSVPRSGPVMDELIEVTARWIAELPADRRDP